MYNTYTYEYDGEGNQTRKLETRADKTLITTYVYDSLNRLLSVTDENGKTTTYTYDRAGNRITEATTLPYAELVKTLALSEEQAEQLRETLCLEVGDEDTTVSLLLTYTYTSKNTPLSITTTVNGMRVKRTSYAHDANGNELTRTELLTVDGGNTSETRIVHQNIYDLRNSLLYTLTPQYLVTNVYDASGQRVKKQVLAYNEASANISTKLFHYDGTNVIMETDEGGMVTARNFYGQQLLLRTVRPDTEEEQTYSYLYNAHGDVVALLSEGNLVATYAYDPFGVLTEQTGDVDSTIRYAGYQYDEETGLYYLNARMYDPVTARFLQRDTYTGNLSDPLSLNRYTYCYNNPERFTDPSGHFAVAIVIGLLIGSISAAAEYRTQKYIENRAGLDYGTILFRGILGAITGFSGSNMGLAMIAALGSGGGAVAAGTTTVLQLTKKQFLKKAAITTIKAATLGAAEGVVTLAAGHFLSKGTFQGLDLNRVRREALWGAATAGIVSTATSVYIYSKNARTFAKTARTREIDVAQNTTLVAKTGELDGIGKLNDEPILESMDADELLRQQAAENTGIKTINPNEIRYSQSSVNGSSELIDSMKENGWKGEPIDVVEMPDGIYTTLDNTRVVAAREAGINVQANVHGYNDILPDECITRFITDKGVPVTWGDAVRLRIGKQKASFRNNNPVGTFEMETIK